MVVFEEIFCYSVGETGESHANLLLYLVSRPKHVDPTRRIRIVTRSADGTNKGVAHFRFTGCRPYVCGYAKARSKFWLSEARVNCERRQSGNSIKLILASWQKGPTYSFQE